METANLYNIATLDGDLLIIHPSLPQVIIAPRAVAQQESPDTIASIADRIQRRESELPHFVLQWRE